MTARTTPAAAVFGLFLLMAVVGGGGRLLAEAAPLSKERLTKEATLVVTGRVTAAEARVRGEGKDGSKNTRHTLTVEVTGVAKGELKDRAKPITVVGGSHVLGRTETGSSGHRSNNTGHGIGQVAAGWEVRLYLVPFGAGVGGGADRDEVVTPGAYHIVFPNGFEVLKEPK